MARLFRGRADLIDQDLVRPTAMRPSSTPGVAAARDTAEGSVGGRSWGDDGAALLAAAYALHAGLSRRGAVAAHVRAMEEPSAVKAGEQHESPGKSVTPGGKDTRDPAAGVPEAPAPARSRPPPVDPMAYRGLAWANWIRPRRPPCGRWWPNCAAARSRPEAS
jgi:hypothetical protein